MMNRFSRLAWGALLLAAASPPVFAQFGTVIVPPISATVAPSTVVLFDTQIQLPWNPPPANLPGRMRIVVLRDGQPLQQTGTFGLNAAAANGPYYDSTAINQSTGQGIYASYVPGTGQVHIHFATKSPAQNETHTYALQLQIDGEVFVADEGNSSVRVLDEATDELVTVASSASAGQSTASNLKSRALSDALSNPKGVAQDANGNLFIADGGHSVIQKLAPDGTLSVFAGSYDVAGTLDGTGTAAEFITPAGLGFDSQGNLYVSDVEANNIRKITPAGVVTTFLGGLSFPFGFVFDPSDNLYVADSYANKILYVTAQGAASVYAGSGAAGSADGTGAAASFSFPCDLALDAQGDLYVTDDVNNTIRKIAPGGVVTTLAGTAGVTGGADGTGPSAQFNYPFGIVLDGDGNLIVSDEGNSTLRRVTPAGVVTTIAGSPGSTGSADGTGSAARLNGPYQICSGFGVVQASAVSTTASGPIATGRLGNLSVLTSAGGSAGTLTAGFVVSGSGTENVLARGIGPTLASFGVSNVLPDPQITLFATGGASPSVIAADAGWGGNSGLAAAFAATGAFALPVSSLDSALVAPLSPGNYSVQLTSAGGHSGQALAELYEDDSGAPTAHFVNQSTLAQAGSGAKTLTAGFVILGPNPDTVVIRGVGPGLGAFNVSNPLPDPVLTLHETINGADTLLGFNAGWGGDALLAQAFGQVGAFSLSPSSADSALAVTLAPGSYSAQVTSAGGNVGPALIEIYEVPQN